MSIVLRLNGLWTSPQSRPLERDEIRGWLTRAAVWFEESGDVVLDAQLGRDAADRPVLRVLLHPASPPAEIRLDLDGRVRVQAVTTPAGPGYHAFLCELLRNFAAAHQVEWILDDCQDATGYFLRHHRPTLEAAFAKWLHQECRRRPHTPGLTYEHEFTYPAEVLTPLGPRSAAWREALARDLSGGQDYFPWWNPHPDAAFYRNRALVRLWCDYPWRPPLTEAEGEAADQIANDLATAFHLDPDAELPWSAWLELLHHIDQDAASERLCVSPYDPNLSIKLWMRAGPHSVPPEKRIGYRRYPIRVRLDGGWTIDIPGDFTYEWDEDRNWTAWNRTHAIWFRRIGFQAPDGRVRSPEELVEFGRRSILDEGDPLPLPSSADSCKRAVFGMIEEDGRTLWRLAGVAAVDGQLVICNVYVQDPAEREWAAAIWQTLRHTQDMARSS